MSVQPGSEATGLTGNPTGTQAAPLARAFPVAQSLAAPPDRVLPVAQPLAATAEAASVSSEISPTTVAPATTGAGAAAAAPEVIIEKPLSPKSKTKNYVFHTFDSLPHAKEKNKPENNYEFTEPLVLVKTLHGLDPKQTPGQGPEVSKVAKSYLSASEMDPFKKDDIIAFNGYAAMNILINILDKEPIDADIAKLVTKTSEIKEKSDIPSLQYLFFMFLAQMIFFANVQARKEIINIRTSSFAEQYEKVRQECVIGIGKKPESFFGVEKQKFETGQKSTANENPGQEKSWWDRASKGAFVCVKGLVTMGDFLEIFNMGPLAMLKCLKLEMDDLKKVSDGSDSRSLISELQKYRDADLFAPEQDAHLELQLSETIGKIKGAKGKIPSRFDTAKELIAYLRNELSTASAERKIDLPGIGQEDEDSGDEDSGDEDEAIVKKKPVVAQGSTTPRPINSKHQPDQMTKGPDLPSLFGKTQKKATSGTTKATGSVAAAPGRPSAVPKSTTAIDASGPSGEKPKGWSFFGRKKSPTAAITTGAAAVTPSAVAKKPWEHPGTTFAVRREPTAEPCEGEFCSIDVNLPSVTTNVTGPASATARPAEEVSIASGAATTVGATVGSAAAASAGAAVGPACDTDMCGDATVGGGKRHRTRKNKATIGSGQAAPVISIKL